MDDVCAAGECRGARFHCPADIRVRPSPGTPARPATVHWEEPEVQHHRQFLFSVSSSHRPGDLFPLGATTVRYQARNLVSNEEYSCSFAIELLEEECKLQCNEPQVRYCWPLSPL